MHTHLVELDAEHPGFRDADYRARRDAIARLAMAHREGTPVPDVPYTHEEQGVYGRVTEALRPLHGRLAHPVVARRIDELGLLDGELPQFEAVNNALVPTGFRLEPVAGLVDARAFLEGLRRSTFLATQYVRHASRPLYTPEPDVIHEMIGHAGSLLDPDLAELSRAFGAAAEQADDDGIVRIIRVYWWTIEFGLVREGSATKALGAGLLSSGGELRGIEDGPAWQPWSIDAMADTPFDPTSPNPVLFVAPSFEVLRDELTAWLSTAGAAARA